MNKDPRYLEQFKRVKRWYGRFKKINDGTKHQVSSDHLKDEVLAFFTNCHHLKDWLEYDQDISKEELIRFIKTKDVLKICGDLCNGSKHLEISEGKEWKDKETGIERQDVKLKLGKGAPEVSMTFWVKSGEKEYNAFNLATECLELWEKFLQDHGLEME
jgi:hypothetical protein